MAITGSTARGNGAIGNNTASASLTQTPGGAVAAGRVLVTFVVTRQNSQVSSLTDALGNTWYRIGRFSNATNGNAHVELWVCRVATALESTTVMTAALESAVNDATIHSREYTVGTGKTLDVVAALVTSEVNAANGFGSSSFSSLPSAERLYLRVAAKRANTTNTITATTNYNSWGINTRSRNAANDAIIGRAEERIVTSTGETSNPTLAVSGNTAGIFAALVEVDVLAAGTASTSSVTATRVQASATAPAGGNGATPVYQWQRRVPAGSWGDLAGQTSLTLDDQTVSPSTAYEYRLRQQVGSQITTTNVLEVTTASLDRRGVVTHIALIAPAAETAQQGERDVSSHVGPVASHAEAAGVLTRRGVFTHVRLVAPAAAEVAERDALSFAAAAASSASRTGAGARAALSTAAASNSEALRSGSGHREASSHAGPVATHAAADGVDARRGVVTHIRLTAPEALAVEPEVRAARSWSGVVASHAAADGQVVEQRRGVLTHIRLVAPAAVGVEPAIMLLGAPPRDQDEAIGGALVVSEPSERAARSWAGPVVSWAGAEFVEARRGVVTHVRLVAPAALPAEPALMLLGAPPRDQDQVFGGVAVIVEPQAAERSASSHAGSIVTSATRAGAAAREARSHSLPASSAAARFPGFTNLREARSHSAPVSARAERAGTATRAASTWSGSVVSLAGRAGTGARAATSHTGVASSSADRVPSSVRVASSHARTVSATAERTLGTGSRMVASYVGMISSRADASRRDPPVRQVTLPFTLHDRAELSFTLHDQATLPMTLHDRARAPFTIGGE